MSVDKDLNNLSFSFLIKDPQKRVKTLVRKICHHGETDLDRDDLKELKDICKACDDSLMVVVFKICMKCLEKDHSQVRVSTVKLLDYLFKKSHIIRNELLDEFERFLELSLAISQAPKVKLNLPPPKKYAALLQEITAKCIHKWHSDFAAGYEKLRYAYRFLKEHKLVDFSQFQVRTQEQLIQQQKLVERQERILTRTIDNRLKEFKELKPEIEQLIVKIESSLEVLLPNDNELQEAEATPCESEHQVSYEINQRQHGIANLSSTVEIEFSPYIEIVKNPDNKEMVQVLKELKRELVEGKLCKLIAIEKTLSKRSDQLLSTLREIINLKAKAMNVVMKLGDLKIVEDNLHSNTLDTVKSDDDSSENDFEDVAPKEGLETYIPKSMRYEYGLAPINPSELENTNRVALTDESFGAGSSNGNGSMTGDTFVMSCNVRLESGKLCPRKDKSKCPFHGKIIPRDHKGVPINEDDRQREETEAKRRGKEAVPEWQDPDLLREISAATGVDLTMPKAGRRKKQSPNKNLADTKTCDLTPKQRLQKRLKLLTR